MGEGPGVFVSGGNSSLSQELGGRRRWLRSRSLSVSAPECVAVSVGCLAFA